MIARLTWLRSWRFRLLILLALGTLAAAGAVAYVHYWHARPIGHGPTRIPLPPRASAQPWSDRPVLLLGLGDSITAGFGASPGHSYFSRLSKRRANSPLDVDCYSLAEVLPQLRVDNAALSGSTSLELEDILLPRVPVHSPEVFGIVVLTTGGNDVIHNYGRTPPREGEMYGATWDQAQPWIANYRARLTRILEGIGQRFPGGCEIFVGNIYDPTDGLGDIEHAGLPAWRDGLRIHAAYNAVIADVCRDRPGTHVIDLRAAFLGHGIHCAQWWRKTYDAQDPRYWYYDNLEDPNDRGYDAIFRLYLGEISRTVPLRLE